MKFIIAATADLREYTLTFSYSFFVFLCSLTFSLLTVAIAAMIPAKRLSRITPLDAIRYGNEPTIKRVRKYRICTAVFGIYGELACKSLFVRRKAMRIGTLSIMLAVFACISLLNMFGVSNLSTQKTYFDRFKDNWDFLITNEGNTYNKELLREIRNTEDVASCIVHRTVEGNTTIHRDYLSDEVNKLGLDKLNSRFEVKSEGTFNVNVPIYILDDSSFEKYRGVATDADVIVVNTIWDSVHSERSNRKYVPFLDIRKKIVLDINGTNIPVSDFTSNLPILREELSQYSLTLVMSESYYDSLNLNMVADETIYTIKMTDESKYDVVEKCLKKLSMIYPGYEDAP